MTAFAPFFIYKPKNLGAVFFTMNFRHKNMTKKLIRQRKVNGLRITPRLIEQSKDTKKTEKDIEKYG